MPERDTQSPGLVVRQHKRYDVALDAELSVAPEHAGRLRLSPSAGGRTGRIGVIVTDFSSGGLGVSSTVFLPRHALAIVRIKNPARPDGPPILEARGAVQRVTMTDHRPGYLLGVAFADRHPEFRAQIEAFMRTLDEGGAKPAEPAPARAGAAPGGPARA